MSKKSEPGRKPGAGPAKSAKRSAPTLAAKGSGGEAEPLGAPKKGKKAAAARKPDGASAAPVLAKPAASPRRASKAAAVAEAPAAPVAPAEVKRAASSRRGKRAVVAAETLVAPVAPAEVKPAASSPRGRKAGAADAGAVAEAPAEAKPGTSPRRGRKAAVPAEAAVALDAQAGSKPSRRGKRASGGAKAPAQPPAAHALEAAGLAEAFDSERPEVVATWRAIDLARAEEDLEWRDFVSFAIRYAALSEAQLMQDLWVLWETKFKTNGYFIEFGACDGRWLSNSYALETRFGWNGVVAEPNPIYHAELDKMRRCVVDHRCVWTTSGKVLPFNAVADGEFSRLAEVDPGDLHEESGRRAKFDRIEVPTISLIDLLDEAKAPAKIDYLSIDTEGSEFDILAAFDFDRFDIRLISVEHNYAARRADILALLKHHGYRHRFPGKTRWDDWFVRG